MHFTLKIKSVTTSAPDTLDTLAPDILDSVRPHAQVIPCPLSLHAKDFKKLQI